MGLFQWFRKKLSSMKPGILEDPLFGPLVFCEPSSWQTAAGHEKDVIFYPTGDHISITVTGDEKGPSPEARPVYHDLVERYEQLFPLIASVLETDYKLAHPDVQDPTDAQILSAFTLRSITILIPMNETEWQLTLTYRAKWNFEMHSEVIIQHGEADAMRPSTL